MCQSGDHARGSIAAWSIKSFFPRVCNTKIPYENPPWKTLPSGNLTIAFKCPIEIVDLPVKDGDFP